MKGLTFELVLERMTILGIWGLVASIVMGVFYCIVMSIIAPDVWEYCYITKISYNEVVSFEVEASKNWASDPTLGYTQTLKEAKELALANDCPVKGAD